MIDADSLYLMGADDDDDDDPDDFALLGARRRGMRSFGRRRKRGGSKRRALRRALVRKPAGTAPAGGLGMYYLGFPVANWVPASVLAVTVDSNTQKPFKPMKFSSNRSDTGAPGGLITVTQALVGTENVLLSANGIGQATFASVANLGQQNIAWPEAKPGITITIQYTNTATPGAATAVDVSSDLSGPTAV